MALAAAAGLSSAPAPATAQEFFIGQILYLPYNFCPRATTAAAGQLLPIAENTALFSLYGTIYGGDGRTTMGLPNLKGRIPVHMGRGPGLSDRRIGSVMGAASVTLTQNNLPSHTHTPSLNVTTATGASGNPTGGAIAMSNSAAYAGRASFDTALQAGTAHLDTQGGSQPFNLLMPTETLQPCVVLQGIYPSRN